MIRYIFILSALFLSISGMGQVNIGGDTLNNYYSVSALPSASSVTCAGEDLSALKPGDKVLLMQMTGANFNSFNITNPDIPNNRYDPFDDNEGYYELLSVLSVNNVTKVISFTADLKNTYTTTEKVQLVRAFETEHAIVDSALTAEPWNGTKGGILFLIITRKLELNADINLTGKGFRGGASILYDAPCRADAALDSLYYHEDSINKGGNKGEGIASISEERSIGMGHFFNGAGGGYGKFGGGAGGGNYDLGGDGGPQLESCNGTFENVSLAGIGLETGLTSRGPKGTDGFYSGYMKLSFGGGGGGSTFAPGNFSPDGGNGGGLLILLTDTLDGNGNKIILDGISVIDSADQNAGAGGGGAGGTAVLDVTYYSSNVAVQARGGNGGNATGSSDCGGAGGGGAGGALLLSKNTIPPELTYDLSEGAGGVSECGNTSPFNGEPGDTIGNYLPVLNGFTFNSITGTDTICNGQTPRIILGTIPKGATNYTYQWLYRYNETDSWSSVVPAATNKDYQPPALFDTIYYTRRVNFPDDGISDTAFSVQIMVYPPISDNTLTLRDTLCSGTVPGLLSANTVVGGDGSNYRYAWESSVNQPSWTPRGDVNTENLTENNPLTQDTYYRRYVESGPNGVCSDTSDVDTITILNQITSNTILNPFRDTSICFGFQAGTTIGSDPSGGDGDYDYTWLSSPDNNNNYVPIPLETSKHLNPGALNSTIYYKRVVYSGEGDACIDTTTLPRRTEVVPTITNNNITSDSTRYCSGDSPLELKQDNPGLGGGDGFFYYQWQHYDGSKWNSITNQNSNNFLPGVLTDTSVYRRVVSSGEVVLADTLFACNDTSTSITIDVIPAITNDVVSPDENICQSTQPLDFTELPATGGAGAFSYQWEQNVDSAGWTNADGTSNQVSYSPSVLNNSTAYRRKAISQICESNSSVIAITVYDSIVNNRILGPTTQYACFKSEKLFEATQPAGGNNVYSYVWQSSPDNVLWNDTVSTAKEYSLTSADTLKHFRRIVNSGETAQCKDTSGVVMLLINPLPSGDIISSIDTLCAGEKIEVAFADLTGNGPWMIQLGESNELHTEPNIEDTAGVIDFELSSSANIKMLLLRDDSLCYADISGNSGLVKAKVYDVPIADAGIYPEVCGLTTQLNATLSTPGSGYWQTDEGQFDDSTLTNATVTMMSYGLKTLMWMEKNWQCTDQAVVDIEFFEQPIEIDAGDDIVLEYKFDTTLNALPPPFPVQGYWKFKFGEGELEDSTAYNTLVILPDLGEYILEWTLINSVCEPIKDTMSITVNDLARHNGFSPNGDGINDEYILEFPSGNLVKFTLLDRNGSVVRVITSRYEISWDGSNEGGQQVPADTYYYIIEEEGWPSRNGFIEIRR